MILTGVSPLFVTCQDTVVSPVDGSHSAFAAYTTEGAGSDRWVVVGSSDVSAGGVVSGGSVVADTVVAGAVVAGAVLAGAVVAGAVVAGIGEGCVVVGCG
jgi:hypothetical protein